jgi:hypothetical protein
MQKNDNIFIFFIINIKYIRDISTQNKKIKHYISMYISNKR